MLTTLLDEMGVVTGRTADDTPIIAEEVLCRDPQERIFFRGRWYEGLYLHAGATHDDTAQFQRFQGEIDRWARLIFTASNAGSAFIASATVWVRHQTLSEGAAALDWVSVFMSCARRWPIWLCRY